MAAKGFALQWAVIPHRGKNRSANRFSISRMWANNFLMAVDGIDEIGRR
jgi:hypothetical protein